MGFTLQQSYTNSPGVWGKGSLMELRGDLIEDAYVKGMLQVVAVSYLMYLLSAK
jgi:hypothetical protein